ncbi:MAG TPA: hypothetical protein PK542_01015 [Treponemataceae bacterium]|nr:hypothetical protein [Treponemataceae bacterium]HPS43046.1 hypothetical protein [Treponemataceae bacterium]
MTEKKVPEGTVKAPDTARKDQRAQHAPRADESANYCTKPFDPENSRSRDPDDPCVNGES